MMAGYIFVALIVLLPIVFVLAQYNGLIGLRNHIDNAWSNIDTELKRRYELIPNLWRRSRDMPLTKRKRFSKLPNCATSA